MAEQQPILSESASLELANGILKLAEQIAQRKIETTTKEMGYANRIKKVIQMYT